MTIKLNRLESETWYLYKNESKIGIVTDYLQFLDICIQIKENKATGYSFRIETETEYKECCINSDGRFESRFEDVPFEILDDLLRGLI